MIVISFAYDRILMLSNLGRGISWMKVQKGMAREQHLGVCHFGVGGIWTLFDKIDLTYALCIFEISSIYLYSTHLRIRFAILVAFVFASIHSFYIYFMLLFIINYHTQVFLEFHFLSIHYLFLIIYSRRKLDFNIASKVKLIPKSVLLNLGLVIKEKRKLVHSKLMIE